MSRLFIAEKPSVGRAIADVLGIASKEKSHIKCKNGDVVTWAFGHLLELADPSCYSGVGKAWKKEVLPIIPEVWKSNPRKDVLHQLNAIGLLLKEFRHVIHAGDPDREGQYLVDEILEYFLFTGKVERILLSALDRASVLKALDGIRPNTEFWSLKDAARARSYSDWLFGMNGTRAMTLQAKECGFIFDKEVLSLGRVQTPTLALVVERDRMIENFRAESYLTITCDLKHSSEIFKGVYVPKVSELDPKNSRFNDEKRAKEIAEILSGSVGRVVEVKREQKTRSVPLPHCLSSLQKELSASEGMTAQQTLDAAQTLYERRLTTYPRTDCQYLPEEQLENVERILSALSEIPELKDVAEHADKGLVGPVWDTEKVTAHHAIIPTGEPLPEDLDKRTMAAYRAIALAYCLQFYAPCEYESQKITFDVQGLCVEARGRVVTSAGWTAYKADLSDDEKKKAKEEDQHLPDVKEGHMVPCKSATVQKKKTSAPKRFTEGTLIEAMANIHKYLSNEEKDAKSVLKETEGIGTEATRAGIIEKLKNYDLLTVQKKSLISTERARVLVDHSPQLLTDPITTAQWETSLKNIVNKQLTFEAFLKEQEALIPTLVCDIFEQKFEPRYVCGECGGPILQFYSTAKEKMYWVCKNHDEWRWLGPTDAEPILPDTENEVEGEFLCPHCNQPLQKQFVKSKGCRQWICRNHETAKWFGACSQEPELRVIEPDAPQTEFKCPDCGAFLEKHFVRSRNAKMWVCKNHDEWKWFGNADTAPDFSEKTSQKSEYQCPVCKLPLFRREKKYEDGEVKVYWACFEKSKHKGQPVFLDDKDGKPDFETFKNKKKK